MAHAVEIGGLRIHGDLNALIRDEIAPGTAVAPEALWSSLEKIVRDLGPANRALLERRAHLGREIDLGIS